GLEERDEMLPPLAPRLSDERCLSVDQDVEQDQRRRCRAAVRFDRAEVGDVHAALELLKARRRVAVHGDDLAIDDECAPNPLVQRADRVGYLRKLFRLGQAVATDEADGAALRQGQNANSIILGLEHPILAPRDLGPDGSEHGRRRFHALLRRRARAPRAVVPPWRVPDARCRFLPISRLSCSRAMRSTTWVLSRSSGSGTSIFFPFILARMIFIRLS